MMKPITKLGAVLAASLFVGSTAMAQIVVYDNTTTSLNKFYSAGNNVDFGDEIRVSGQAPSGRFMTSFQFEYFLSLGASGNETATLSIRRLDGPVGSNGPTPGTLLYSSGSFPVTSGYHQVAATGLNTLIPDTVVWTVKFSGLEGTEQAGLLYYDPPTVGSSATDFWQLNGSTWTLELTPGAISNFGARVLAVPEPGTWGLMLGGLAAAGLMAYRRKS